MVKRTLSLSLDPPRRPAKKRKTTRRVVSTSIGPSRDYRLLKTKQKVTMRYADTYTLNPGASGAPGTHVFSCNGLFDPDITGVGHQPRGFDQMMALYDHYHVNAATIECWFNHDDVSGTVYAINIRDTPSAPISRTSILENAYGTMTASSRQLGRTYLRFTVDPAKYLGQKKFEDKITGSISANPLDQCYFQVTAMSQDITKDIGSIFFTAKITYDVTVLEPKNPTES